MPRQNIAGPYELQPSDANLVLARGPLPLAWLQEAVELASTTDDPSPINVNPEHFTDKPFSVAFSAQAAGELADHIENNILRAQVRMQDRVYQRGLSSHVELTFMLSRYHRVLTWLDDIFAIGSGVAVREVKFDQE